MHIGLSLIALALGYKIFIEATKEKGGRKTLGRAIGIYVMLLGFLASVFWIAKYSNYYRCKMQGGRCPIMAMCPVKR